MTRDDDPRPLGFACWLLAAVAPAAEPTTADLLAKLKPGHPRVLATADDFAALKERLKADAALKGWYAELRRDAERSLADKPIEYGKTDGTRMIHPAMTAAARVSTWALVYRVEGDRRFADRAWAELDAVAAFPDWNPSHFLDTAILTHAAAVGYDWLFDAWTPGQRDRVRQAIVTHGLTPGLKHYRGEMTGTWVRRVNNWNQVCNGGLTLGALAVADEEPAVAGETLAGALKSVPLAMREYAPAGGYREGSAYWEFGTFYNVLMLAALGSGLGTDFGLSASPGFADTPAFPIETTGPFDRPFNFADAGDATVPAGGRSGSHWWFANRFDRPEFAGAGSRFGWPDAAMSILWYRPTAPADPAKRPLGRYWPGPEVVTARTRWDDMGAGFVGFKAGKPTFDHGQADLGSFVYDALGTRWALDLGGDGYNLPGYFERKGGGRWAYYRNRAEGHNTLVLNPGKGPDQAPDALTTVGRHAFGPSGSWAVADLTVAYQPAGATAVRRGVRLDGDRGLLIQDEVEAAGAELLWFLHTRTEVTAAGRRAELRDSGRPLWAEIVEPATARFEVRPAEPLPTSPDGAGQTKNTDVRKLTVRMKLPAGPTRLVVWLSPGERRPPPAVVPLADWR